mmetsp:Transcript_3824/g.13408  ORF Transcript_3824/g.13408 Transcript_3824/m.13408 type:complete len:217 (-) Transcript_3824:703-1353(-)
MIQKLIWAEPSLCKILPPRHAGGNVPQAVAPLRTVLGWWRFRSPLNRLKVNWWSWRDEVLVDVSERWCVAKFVFPIPHAVLLFFVPHFNINVSLKPTIWFLGNPNVVMAQGGVGDVVLLQEPHRPCKDQIDENEVHPQERFVWAHVRHSGPEESVCILLGIRVLAPIVPIALCCVVNGQKDPQRYDTNWNKKLHGEHQEAGVHQSVKSRALEERLV